MHSQHTTVQRPRWFAPCFDCFSIALVRTVFLWHVSVLVDYCIDRHLQTSEPCVTRPHLQKRSSHILPAATFLYWACLMGSLHGACSPDQDKGGSISPYQIHTDALLELTLNALERLVL